jgi:hypothetical protein
VSKPTNEQLANQLFDAMRALAGLVQAVAVEEQDMTDSQRDALNKARTVRDLIANRMGWDQ